jgi:SNF2 family DNA or RNA helicase
MEVSAPWPQQQSGSDWLRQRLYGYLGHEVGCGKSRTLLMAVRDRRLVLVVCPIAVGPAWAKQVRLFCPGRKVVVAVAGTSAARAKAIRSAIEAGGPVLVVVNYDSVYRGEVGKLVSGTSWDAIACDEAHRIKSPTGKASKFLAKLSKSLPQSLRVCLSGTPTPNNPCDWWAQFRFLDADVLGGSFPAFRDRIAYTHPQYKGWITGFKEEALSALRGRLDEHVHRVRADEVLTLPPAIHTTVEVALSREAAAFYERLENDMVARLQSGEVVTAANQMVVVNRLHLAASGFARPDGEEKFHRIAGEPDKLLAFRDWLEDFPAREPLVVFVKFLEDLREVAEECERSGRRVSRLCGSVKQLEAWQAGETDVIVVQQQAGGAGVDLTRASYCVFYSLSHSLGDYEQAVGRLHRPGQEKCCRYYHFVVSGTVDEAIYQAIEDKGEVVQSVLANLTRRVANASGA